MRFLVVTNRRLENEDSTDESMFGEKVNLKGPLELRFAWAKRCNSDPHKRSRSGINGILNWSRSQKKSIRITLQEIG